MGVCCSTLKARYAGRETPSPSPPPAAAAPLAAGPVAVNPKDTKKRQKEKMTELRAVILIQKLYRKWTSRLKLRKEVIWQIHRYSEYYAERNQMKLNRFFRVIIDEFSTGAYEVKNAQLVVNASIEAPQISIMAVPDDSGVNVSPPFSVSKLATLINYLKKGNNLHYTCVINLLIMTIELMKAKGNFNVVSSNVTRKITICGDLHGSLDDLLHIFHLNSIPGIDNPYVFNGNLIDRGKKAIEVAAVLCYCFLLYPDHVYLNRGNHEDHNLIIRYGLLNEILCKYRYSEKILLNLFKTLFRYLPLGTIIDNKILVINGGISHDTSLETLMEIDRSNYPSVIKPQRDIIKNESLEWKQVVDVLWNEPSKKFGCAPNDNRGGGSWFGQDVTQTFLKKHKLQLIVRSHECKQKGYDYCHSNKVLTIFSCSDYYYTGSNDATYMIYTGNIEDLHLMQFNTSNESHLYDSLSREVYSIEQFALYEVQKMLSTHRMELFERFLEIDEKETGWIKMSDLRTVLCEVVGLKLPWILIAPRISKTDSRSRVYYETLLNFSPNIVEETCYDILYSNMEVLETIFRAIDCDSSGFITMIEFQDAMAVLQKNSDLEYDTDDIMELGELIDIDKDGVIDINDFFESFKISRS